MADRQRYYDPVCNEIPEAVKIILDLRFSGITAVLFVVVIDIFQNIAVKLLLGTDQGLNPPLERKRQERIFLGSTAKSKSPNVPEVL